MKRSLAIVWMALSVIVGLFWAKPCEAYPWMVRHEYTGCATCHTDPSGGFLLTAYGRAQTQTLLSTFGKGPEGNEVDRRSQLLWGAVSTPDWADAGASLRYLYLYNKPNGTPATTRSILMQADLRGAIHVGAFEAAGSLGYAHEGGKDAWVTSRAQGDNLVAREFWVGYNFDEERNTKLRAGRLYLPYGLRVLDHTLFVRNATRTDLDAQQQYGLSLFHGADNYRVEVMAVLGNYQLRPDKYRERGYSAYVEYSALDRLALGVSSLLTYQGESSSPSITGAAIRGAHGPFLRWAPIRSLALMSEWDVLHNGPTSGGAPIVGLAGLIQADWEFYRGLHAVATPELYLSDFQVGTDSTSYRGWLTAAWFAYPHVDFRIDGIYGSESFAGTRMDYVMALGQAHVSL